MASRFLRRNFLLNMALAALPLMAAACGGNSDANNLAALDAQLTNDMSDPALRGALEDQIAVDPDLARQSNARSVRPGDKPMSGAVPFTSANFAAAAAEAKRLAGGALQSAPAAAKAEPCAECGADRPVTLGALARQQGKSCGALKYGMGWAERLPAGLPIYPGAKLMEAAGVDGGQCGLRAASFVAPASMKDVIDFYYTMARRAGYDADHRMLNGEHVLGGNRASDDGAYVITFAGAPGGGATVDLIASNGR